MVRVPHGGSGSRRRRGQGELEGQVLAALRAADRPVNAGWVQERLGAGLAYTTVMTILTRLLAKGTVTRRREGRSFVWEPAADEAGLAALRMRKVLDGEADREAVLTSFVTTLGPDDEQLIRALLAGGDEMHGADDTDDADETDAMDRAGETDEAGGTGDAGGAADEPES
ncbi:BlaI/MecI/CopY family transcriptional regulator [Streptomyces sp. B-S-A8]|uniref:BlaI/MecI/CopY family transcriptional regulator n=1 Tax=Streptomyces solicavernae TaxID=3043614 RepID=A0ABT6RMH5_9ACTN|nr:BlaI/MecI/CopY family transcriptional regulator [Streptomyces sp. B-S-A8]MDI3384881.1 BlaI/MecI/CopY family transcriptional regulator [Streptomyces sp. B-S-A8]